MNGDSLDPADWDAFRALAHRALDNTLDALRHAGDGPAWRAMPPDVRAAFAADPVPRAPVSAEAAYATFESLVAPYAVDNRHPRFFGWVHGAGTATGVLAEMLAAGMNANAGGRDHAAVELERVVVRWWRDVFGFPASATGILTTGTSIANLIALLVARAGAAGDVRRAGLRGADEFTAYASTEAHSSLRRAFDIAGFGSDTLRAIGVDARRGLDVRAVHAAIDADRAAGRRPFALIATAGSASTGAVDDLAALADVARDERLWFHVDGAFGALAVLSPAQRPLVAGIERADSLAFDLHKWLHVPYDAGAVLVRDGALHQGTFAEHADYLARAQRGTAAGQPWLTDFGPELSRGFRALKVWFTMKTYGLDHFGTLIARQCAMARALAARIVATPPLELLAPVTLNVVCFRYAAGPCEDARDALNAEIAVELQERGIAVLSTTRVDGRLALRMNVMNHRTQTADLDATLEAVLATGSALVGPQLPVGVEGRRSGVVGPG